ncbi:hypothetical protein ACIGCZ_37110 [Streptomyces nigra]|uniref:hypothetical protein n=1 Tax=Streptomyces nigra TaxID=1827580 RepID=UPI0037D926FC
MADYTSETITRTIRRWIIPAAEPWGAPAAEVRKAWAAAELDYRRHFGIPAEQPLHDDALRFHVTDEAVVIEWQEEARRQ